MQKILINLVHFYSRFISPLHGPCCRFHPTCSEYTAQAIEKYGAVRGTWRGIKRLCRCQPLCEGGVDPLT